MPKLTDAELQEALTRWENTSNRSAILECLDTYRDLLGMAARDGTDDDIQIRLDAVMTALHMYASTAPPPDRPRKDDKFGL